MKEGLEKNNIERNVYREIVRTCTATKRGNFPRSVGSTLVPIKIGSSPRFLLRASGVLARATQYRRIQQRRTG